ncbi:cupin domain-containing protein [Streptomyces marispadix]|uniref:Cupin domain-containing protein n=1 Tax=Streptomyces marispadix TaxID=2922868 RepID=A0ABS9T1B7_9ACTN|nr:cupin domain-containing protein [Streptomyces marispadix]MCH6162268.1 cupin domain-containing protein [Streptomyces marispadix]
MSQPSLDALIQPPGHGEGLWHLDVLWTLKIPAAATGGAFSLSEQLIPKGSAPPVHRHSREDEAWIVLDGEVTFFLDDEQHTAGPGTYVFGPRGRAHSHRVESETARLATLLFPGTCEDFFHSTGRPARSLTLPPHEQPDFEKLREGMREHGIEFIAPPPAPSR